MYSGLQTGRFVQPDAVTTHFCLRRGDRVADFGAGTGYFLSALAKAVGGEGRVYACEIQKNLIEKIGIEIRERRLTNVEVVWSDIESENGIALKDGILDAGIMSNVFFQLSDRRAALTEIARVLRKGGKLLIIDWSESFGGLGPSPDSVVQKKTAIAEAEAAGFQFEREFPAGAHHYGVSLRRL